MVYSLKDATGDLGELLLELALTNCSTFPTPLFRRPVFLGAKWPGIDYYVELTGVSGKRPYFFIQCKATNAPITQKLSISSKKSDIGQMLEIPGPTYIMGVHVPTQKVYAKSVHFGVPAKAITRIQLAYELTPANLLHLHKEVSAYWQSIAYKPTHSVFA